jgi:hypothetical protein
MLAETQCHADIDAEPDKNDWVRAIVDVPVSAVDRGPLPSSICRLYPTNRGEALIDMERFVNARAEDDYYWTLRDRFEHGSSALTAPLSWPS